MSSARPTAASAVRDLS